MAQLPEIPRRPQDRSLEGLWRYVEELERAVRFLSLHVEEENIRNGAVGEAQLSDGVKAEIREFRRAIGSQEKQLTEYRQSMNEIELFVKSVKSGGIALVNNTVLRLNENGIDLEGGEINISGASAINVNGGAMSLSGKAGSHIEILDGNGDPLFQVEPDGTVHGKEFKVNGE